MKYPNKIKSARIDANMTHAELAEKIGVTVQAVTHFRHIEHHIFMAD